MQYQIKAGAAEKQRTACLVLAVFERRKLSAPAKAADAACDGALGRAVATGDLDGHFGRSLLLRELPGLAAERVLLINAGKPANWSPARYAKLAKAAARELGRLGARDCYNTLPLLEVKGREAAWKLQQTVLATEDAWYRFEELRDKKSPARKLKTMTLAVERRGDALERALAAAKATAGGVALAKNLGNRPGNLCTPTDLANLAVDMGKKHKNLSTKVLEESDMEKLGMGALLSVSRGSRQPAKLIIMNYQGGKKKDPPIALVGKGLTFDAGGISLKPAQKMEEMKFDMCGGATVFGVMQALTELQLPINVVGVVPSSENLPDGNANKPGDVVTSMAGITIEVINTDAEGRLILCDALTYTQKEYQPEVIVDMATLTGACVVALGRPATGLFCNNDALARALLAAGEETGDRAWQMPLWEDYQDLLKSPVADVSNVGGPTAGAITAASFLHRFTRKARWAHLDIAGTAWGDDKLGTGRPVPLLVNYLLGRSAKA